MITLKGKAVFTGIAVGKAVVYRKTGGSVRREKVADAASELERFEDARQQAEGELGDLYRKALSEVGEVNAAIFEVHQLMLKDPDYVGAIRHMIESQSVNAEYAVVSIGDHFGEMFSSMEDDYMRERAADVKDVSGRLCAILTGEENGGVPGTGPVILAADDLAPSETVQLDKSRILAFVTRHGSTNSHTAILARTMNIPALISVDFPEEIDGKEAVLDGYAGILYVEPEEAVRKRSFQRQQEDQKRRELLLTLRGKETVTPDGKAVRLYANIGSVSDAGAALANDAGGIGLFRSEFLYLGREDYPDEEAQFRAYKTVAETMAEKPVIIRTLDIGADKKADYFNLDPEENPAMGYRAIRICLDRPEVFRTQLRAIWRASHYGRISVMFPMITSVEEVRRIKEITEGVKAELTAEELPFGEVELGIMVETPAAAVISDLLAKEVDFFSIGTNDLTQYVLALDRQNPKLDRFFAPRHEAVLRLIATVVENGHKEGCWVGICGELAADLELTEWFLRIGVDELSVSPSFVLPVREKIRGIRLK